MEVCMTSAQQKRLRELGESQKDVELVFTETGACNQYFQKREGALVRKSREQLKNLMENERRSMLNRLTERLGAALRKEGFLQVETPIIISRDFLNRMSIDDSNPLQEQVFWVDENSCLRPMLAPNLYEVSRKLMPVLPMPLRVFEIGSCFRKESEGKSHLKEFTMLNLVEWGLPEDSRIARLKQMAELVLEAAEIDNYRIEEENSVVYGDGLDIVDSDGLELASTSMGPHRLDAAWKISCTWVGLGFGLERLLQSKQKTEGIHRYAKSITYLNGICLSIK